MPVSLASNAPIEGITLFGADVWLVDARPLARDSEEGRAGQGGRLQASGLPPADVGLDRSLNDRVGIRFQQVTESL